jgi:hypothetical protein
MDAQEKLFYEWWLRNAPELMKQGATVEKSKFAWDTAWQAATERAAEIADRIGNEYDIVPDIGKAIREQGGT